MVVAISWSSYFTGMLHGFGIDLPDWLTMGYQTGAEAFHKLQNSSPGSLDAGILQAAHTYQTAPVLFGTKILFNLPAGAIVVFLSTLAYIGIRESKMFSNFLVYLKMAIIVAVIVGGAFFVKPANWSPFAPNGMQGVLGGVAAVFFAFIGFDSISTTAEECRNPQRDMPRAMLICLAVCTLLYVAIALVLTGMRPYSELGVDDPLAYVFERVDMNFIAGVISITSVIAITSAILVFQIGQPRIWLAMSRDGLLGKRFAGIHPRFRTPAFSTVVAGILVAVPAFFLDMKMVVDLTSVGTFFAFILVCAGILYLDHRGYSRTAKFRVPYINGKYVVGLLFVLGLVALVFTVDDLPGFLAEKPLLTVMAVVWLGLSVLSYRYNCSLLPVLGILVNLYLMSELGLSNWLMFLVWLAAGLIIYFCYGYRKSRLRAGS
jgi:amino acid transporter